MSTRFTVYLSSVLVFTSLLFVAQPLIAAPTLTEITEVTDLGILDQVEGVTVVGNYLYTAAATSDALAIYDITDPENPTLVGSVVDAINLDSVYHVEVVDDYAFLSSFTGDAFVSVDISNPATPAIADVLENVGSELDGPAHFTIEGDYAIVPAFNGDSLTIVDISDPLNLAIDSTVSGGSMISPFSVTRAGDYIYVGSFGGATIETFSAPTLGSNVAPVEVDSDSTGTLSSSLFVVGDILYVAGSSLISFDVTDPANPVYLDQATTSAAIKSAKPHPANNNYIYGVSSTADKIVLVDATDPSDMIEVAQYISANFNDARYFDVSGDYAFVGSSDDASIVVILSSDVPPPVDDDESSTSNSAPSSGIRRLIALRKNNLLPNTTTTNTHQLCSSTVFLRQGSVGTLVSELQSKLDILADGIFGSQTKSTTMAYQSTNNLLVDGIVGPQTRGALCK